MISGDLVRPRLSLRLRLAERILSVAREIRAPMLLSTLLRPRWWVFRDEVGTGGEIMEMGGLLFCPSLDSCSSSMTISIIPELAPYAAGLEPGNGAGGGGGGEARC